MQARLSIRSYTRTLRAHSHEYYQLVLPLHGTIALTTNNQSDRVGPGRCVVIQHHTEHHFAADEAARFLVADLDALPDNMQGLATPFCTISPALLAFCHYVEHQLQQPHDAALNAEISALFVSLLRQEIFDTRFDPRISRVLEHLQQDLSQTPTLPQLAELACLSLSHFKSLFRQQTGTSPQQYLSNLRMEKARALLTHTDTPVTIIAQQLGYQDLSAFSRRFRQHFGQSPRHFRN